MNNFYDKFVTSVITDQKKGILSESKADSIVSYSYLVYVYEGANMDFIDIMKQAKDNYRASIKKCKKYINEGNKEAAKNALIESKSYLMVLRKNIEEIDVNTSSNIISSVVSILTNITVVGSAFFGINILLKKIKQSQEKLIDNNPEGTGDPVYDNIIKNAKFAIKNANKVIKETNPSVKNAKNIAAAAATREVLRIGVTALKNAKTASEIAKATNIFKNKATEVVTKEIKKIEKEISKL